MPFDANGNFSLVAGYKAVTGQKVLASQHNPPLEDIGASLSQTAMRDGRTPWAGNQNANGFKVTGLANGTNAQDAVTVSQLQGVGDVATAINGAATKTAPAADDRFVLTDSAASYVISKITYGDLRTAINGALLSAANTWAAAQTFSGNITVGGTITSTGNITYSSDIALKENITSIGDALERVKALGGYFYDRKDSGEHSAGLIAQEVEKVLPEAVHTDESGMKSIAVGPLIGLLVQAIKELAK